jgi:hypothetical protein
VRKFLLFALAVALFLGSAAYSSAQTQPKPLVVISFAGFDKLLGDVAAIGQMGGNPNLGKHLQVMMMMLPQGEFARGPFGLNTQRPWGALIQSDGKAASSYVFLPTMDMKTMIELAKIQLGRDISQDGEIYKIPIEGKTVYAIQKQRWAFLSDSKEQLDKLPEEPSILLGDLFARYTLVAQISVKNLPKEYRDQLLALLRAGSEVAMLQLPGESAEDNAMRIEMGKQSIEQATILINELDALLLGFNVDAKAKIMYLDLDVTAQAGTKLAAQFAEMKPAKTKFAGLAPPGAALTACSVGAPSDAQIAKMKTGMAALRRSAENGLKSQDIPKDKAKLAMQLLDDIISVVQKTIESKKSDAAMALKLDPTAVALVAGATVADGAKLETTVQKLFDELQNIEQVSRAVKFGSETHQGVHLHTLSMPTPEPMLVPFFGDTLDAVVGVADDRVVAAFGRDAVDTLKKAIDRCKTRPDKEVPPLEIAISVPQVAHFLAEVGNDMQVKLIASALDEMLKERKSNDKNRIVLTVKPIPKGVRTRLEVEEGILGALGAGISRSLGGMSGEAPEKKNP